MFCFGLLVQKLGKTWFRSCKYRRQAAGLQGMIAAQLNLALARTPALTCHRMTLLISSVQCLSLLILQQQGGWSAAMPGGSGGREQAGRGLPLGLPAEDIQQRGGECRQHRRG